MHLVTQQSQIHGRMPVEDMLQKDDLDGQRVWKRILEAVNELQDTRPGDGAAVH